MNWLVCAAKIDHNQFDGEISGSNKKQENLAKFKETGVNLIFKIYLGSHISSRCYMIQAE